MTEAQDLEVPEVEADDLFELSNETEKPESGKDIINQLSAPKKKSRYVRKGLSPEGKLKRQANAKKARETKLAKLKAKKEQPQPVEYTIPEPEEEESEEEEYIIKPYKPKAKPKTSKPISEVNPQTQFYEALMQRLDILDKKVSRKATKPRTQQVIQVLPQPVQPQKQTELPRMKFD